MNAKRLRQRIADGEINDVLSEIIAAEAKAASKAINWQPLVDAAMNCQPEGLFSALTTIQWKLSLCPSTVRKFLKDADRLQHALGRPSSAVKAARAWRRYRGLHIYKIAKKTFQRIRQDEKLDSAVIWDEIFDEFGCIGLTMKRGRPRVRKLIVTGLDTPSALAVQLVADVMCDGSTAAAHSLIYRE